MKGKSRKRRSEFPNGSFIVEAQVLGYSRIAGLDEVGRGPLAGPVVAAAIVLPVGFEHKEIDDSKKLLPEKRKALQQELLGNGEIAWAIAEASVEEIDSLNILHASLLAMRRAVEKLSVVPDYLHIDGNRGLKGPWPERAIVEGDAKCVAIAAASILAKVYRDELMVQLAEEYPQYGFEQHKGYGTSHHRKALKEHGPCPIHRRSFLRNWITLDAEVQHSS